MFDLSPALLNGPSCSLYIQDKTSQQWKPLESMRWVAVGEGKLMCVCTCTNTGRWVWYCMCACIKGKGEGGREGEREREREGTPLSWCSWTTYMYACIVHRVRQAYRICDTITIRIMCRCLCTFILHFTCTCIWSKTTFSTLLAQYAA